MEQAFDARLRPTCRTFPDETNECFLAAGFGNSTEALEPGEVRVQGMSNRRQYRSFSFSDARGGAIRSKDALGKSTRYLRVAFGSIGKITDSESNETWIYTDARGRTKSYRDDDTGTTTFRYTAFDELLLRSDQEYRSTVHQYDDVGRLRTVSAWDLDDEEPETTEFFYDGAVNANAMGRLIGSLSADGHSEEFLYLDPPANGDPLSNRGFVRQVNRTIGGEIFETKLAYNATNQLEHVEYPPSVPSGTAPAAAQRFQVHYGYDATGSLNCVASETVTDCTAGRFWHLDAPDPQGYRIQSESFGNGVASTYDYTEATGRLRSITTRNSSNVLLRDLQYTSYDENGNLKTRSDTHRLPGAAGTTVTIADAFTYGDELDRLTRVDTTTAGNVVSQSITYDDIGNIKTRTGVGTYERVVSGELTLPHGVRHIKDGTGQVLTELDYDETGNVTYRSGMGVQGGSQTTTYTHFNLPRTVTFAGATPGISYEYDANQRRVLMSIGNGTGAEQRVYVGGGYERQTTNGGAVTRHIYKVMAAGCQVAQVVREVNSSASMADSVRYIHADHLGSSQLITDQAGDVVHVQRFDPFGAPEEPASGSNDPGTKRIRAGFTGHESDVETGLVNMRGRIYDPRLGRFMQADPIVHFGASQRLNRYSYVQNNPLNRFDPTGFEDLSDLEAGSAEDDEFNPFGGSSEVGNAGQSEALSGGGVAKSGNEKTYEKLRGEALAKGDMDRVADLDAIHGAAGGGPNENSQADTDTQETGTPSQQAVGGQPVHTETVRGEGAQASAGFSQDGSTPGATTPGFGPGAVGPFIQHFQQATVALEGLADQLVDVAHDVGPAFGPAGDLFALALDVYMATANGEAILNVAMEGALDVAVGMAMASVPKVAKGVGKLSPNQMNKAIAKGKAPRGFRRVDTGKVAGEQTHIHFDSGAALNKDGTWKHGHETLTSAQTEWLKEQGWNLP